MRSTSSLTFVMIGLFTSAALADSAPTQPPAAPATGPISIQAPSTPAATQPAPLCSDDFLLDYFMISTEIKTAQPFVTAGDPVPNLTELATDCAQIERDFPTTTCSSPDTAGDISTADSKDVCVAVSSMYQQTHAGQSIDISILPPTAVTASTPILKLDAARLSLTVKAPADLQKVLNQSAELVLINGAVLGLSAAINSGASARCTLIQAQGTPSVFAAGEVIKFERFAQIYHSGYRQAIFPLVGLGISLMCLSDNDGGLTLGDLTTAFGQLGLISYQH